MFSGLRCCKSKITLRIPSVLECGVVTNSKLHSKGNLLTLNQLPASYRFNSVRYESSPAHWGVPFTDYASKTTLMEKLTQNDIVYAVQDKLVILHDSTGLPWWGVIILTTCIVRTAILPLAIHQQYVIAKMDYVHEQMETTVKSEITKSVKELSDTDEKSNDKKLKQEYFKQMARKRMELYEKHNCHPFKNLVLVLIQVPVWTTVSSAWRNLVAMLPIQDEIAITAFLEMKASGFWYLKDLTVADSSCILAFTLCFTNMAIMEVNKVSRITKSNIIRTCIIVGARTLCVVTIPITAAVPKAIALYWVSSAVYGLVQNLLFLSPTVRRILRIPHTPKLRKKPFERIRNKIKGIFYFFKY